MAVILRRPLLVGGVGLSFALLALQSLQHSAQEIGEFVVWGAIALGGCMWFLQQARSKKAQKPTNSPLDRATVEKAIAQAESVVNQLEVEAENHPANQELREKVSQLKTELDREEIKIAIAGGKAVGKTTLIQVMQSNWLPQLGQNVSLSETPALFTGTDTNLTAETSALEIANASDLVLFLTNGDLTDSEFQTLQQLRTANQHLILALNKQDQYLPDERATIMLALRNRVQGILNQDVVAVSTSPICVKVRQHQVDGSLQEWMEQPAPDIKQLSEHLNQILRDERQQLVWATTYRAALSLKAEVKTVLNQIRRDRTLPVIEQYQWIAAAAAFANPVPALDILATAAITAQLVTDLGGIYQQKFSLQQAQTAAGTMGSLMVKLGLVELSTKAIGAVLKSNAVTYVAGGAVQGVSAAYLTRLAGLSLVEYFQQQEVAASNGLNFEKLGQTMQKVFQQNQQLGFLQTFVKQGVGRLLPASAQPEINNSEIVASC